MKDIIIEQVTKFAMEGGNMTIEGLVVKMDVKDDNENPVQATVTIDSMEVTITRKK